MSSLIFRLRFYCLVAALFVRCSVPHIAGGGTIETTNGFVSGTIVLPSGSPGAHVQVRLLPVDYDYVKNADPVEIDTTDSLGAYGFSKIPFGYYSVEAVHINNRTRLIRSGIHVAVDTMTIHADTLRRTGSIRVTLPPGIDGATGYVYIPGTTFFAFFNDRADVVVDSVPVGVISQIMYSATNSSNSTILRYGVHVTSGDTAVVWNSGWNYSRTITLNTSSSGADVTGSVTNFPVLIRLTADNFDFTQARNNGEDIRFTKHDNAFLSYEIERWDALGKRAELWLKVDTVQGNDSSQSITMYWGNINAPAQSNSASVFDTAHGFQGVWHFGENGDSVYDATGHAFNGKNSGSTPAAGMIGNARNFANGNYIKVSGLLNSPGALTLSAWVQSTVSNGQEVVSLGDNALLRLDDAYERGTSGWYHNSTTIDTSFEITKSGRMLANTGWHFIAYSIDTLKNVQTLSIDGVQCATTNDANPINYKGFGKDTYIGIHGNGKTYFNFTGQIDEVRVSNVPLNPDWIKLCFMNQKEQDALVKW